MTVTTSTHKFALINNIDDNYIDCTSKFKTKKNDRDEIWVVDKKGNYLFYLGNNKIYSKKGVDNVYFIKKDDINLLENLKNVIHVNVNSTLDSH
jgi:hypothetical protein